MSRRGYEFNEELVSYTFGSRFHVNVASHLSGTACSLCHTRRTH